MTKENLKSNSEEPTQSGAQLPLDRITKNETVNEANKNLFYAQIEQGFGVKNLTNFLSRLMEEGKTKVIFKKDSINILHNEEEYNIPVSFFQEVKNPSNRDEVEKWLSGLFEKGPTKMHFKEGVMIIKHNKEEYNIPSELFS